MRPCFTVCTPVCSHLSAYSAKSVCALSCTCMCMFAFYPSLQRKPHILSRSSSHLAGQCLDRHAAGRCHLNLRTSFRELRRASGEFGAQFCDLVVSCFHGSGKALFVGLVILGGLWHGEVTSCLHPEIIDWLKEFKCREEYLHIEDSSQRHADTLSLHGSEAFTCFQLHKASARSSLPKPR